MARRLGAPTPSSLFLYLERGSTNTADPTRSAAEARSLRDLAVRVIETVPPASGAVLLPWLLPLLRGADMGVREHVERFVRDVWLALDGSVGALAPIVEQRLREARD